MTNKELISKIKAEIEMLKSIEYPCDNSQQATGFFNALDRMTDFLDTLESEKPIEGLEVASVELADMLLAKQKDYAISAKADYWNGAHDGVIAGAKWDRSQMMKEAVPFYEILEAVPPGPERENVRIIIVKEDEK